MIMAFVSGETVFGQAFVNAPANVCTTAGTNAERYATITADVTGETVTDTRWTITPGVVGVDFKVLYGTLNTTVAGRGSLTIEFIKPGVYTASATMNTPSGPYSANSFITVKDCSMPVCKGANTTTPMAGFVEDFGSTAIPIPLDPLRGSIQYTANTTGPLGPEEYVIAANTTGQSTDWITTNDHTRNTNGGMLLVNADATKNLLFRRTVSGLCKGAVYRLGAWFKNLDTRTFFETGCGAAYKNPGVTFEVLNAATNAVVATFNTNDISIPLQAAVNNFGWQEYAFSFKTLPGLTDVIVQIRNNAPGGCGNNLAVDDISFSYCTPYIYSFFDGQTDQLGGEYTMCAGSPTNLTSQYTPAGYFTIPHYFWEYSKDSILWTTINGDGDGISGTGTDILHFVEGALLLEGDPVSTTHLFFRLNIYEDGNTESCAAPSMPIKVTLLPNPKVVVPDNEICNGDTATLVATGGFDSYIWDSPVDTTSEEVKVAPDVTSVYTVTGYKSYGAGRTCQRTGQAVVIVDDRPVVDSITGPDNVCFGTEVDLSIDPALSLYDIAWTPNGETAVTDIKDTPGTVGLNTYGVTVTNGMCVIKTYKDITVLDMPTAYAGATDTMYQCNDGNFTMAGTLGADETGKWTIEGAANGAVIGNIANPLTTVTGLASGQSVTLVWSVQKTLNTGCTSTDTIVLMNVAIPITSLAGPDQTQCGTADAFTMAANTPPAGAIGTWDVKQGTASVGNLNSENTIITVTGIQDAMLTWTVSNAVCPGKPDTVILSKKNAPNVTLGVVPNTCSSEPAFTIPYTAPTDNPTKYDVTAAATNAMPGFITITDSAFVASPLLAAYPAATATGTYDFNLTVKHDGAGCATDIPFSLTVTSSSIAPTTVVADKPEVCAGDNVTLTVQDGSLGTGANWVWYADGCGTGSPLGTGLTLTTTVTKTTTYYVRAESAGACGNSGCAAVIVTVVSIAPVATFVPDSITVECEAGKDYTTLFGTPQFSHAPYTTIALNVTSTDQTIMNGCTQKLTRTWTATDACGLTGTAAQTINVVDKTAPVFTTPKPADVTVNCDAIPVAITMDALDNCAGLITVTATDVRQAIAGACASNYKILRTWTATDPCGNSVSAVQTITVKELTPPAFTTAAPNDTLVECGSIPAPVVMTATEYCTGASITATATDTRIAIPGKSCGYQIVRTWLAQDVCGNSNTVSQTITVQDTTRPVFSVMPPADALVDCDNVPAPATNITATDNCGSVKISRTQTQKPVNIPGACGSYEITRTWTATDECGNTATAQQVITVSCDGIPKIALGNDTSLCNGEAIRLRADNDGTSYGGVMTYRWSTGSTEPTLTVTQSGTYSVTVANDCGQASDEINVNFTVCDPKPVFANAFSPNGDGINDRFRPVTQRGMMYGYLLRIYNRWGQLVYSDADPRKGWDGSMNNTSHQANVGTYIWWVTYTKDLKEPPVILNGLVNVVK
ncbi:gliding motility-associated C-terminal domain-containing protein [Chitinophaga rupis]|uniref:Gliding motility-associated C-terminal domain-containing protein n=2 Tax=Chitinophaga rupis TaxID=573321 RepID=A0A1H7T7C7_9BACT|nr:gliding motility-associated C-terminal domain-containing protein [Chitinophaga rupis]